MTTCDARRCNGAWIVDVIGCRLALCALHSRSEIARLDQPMDALGRVAMSSPGLATGRTRACVIGGLNGSFSSLRRLVGLGRVQSNDRLTQSTEEQVPLGRAIKAKAPVWEKTIIPRSFELATKAGKVWVHGNATQHLAEYARGMLTKSVSADLVKLSTQAQLQSLQAAVERALSGGIRYNELLCVGGCGI